MKKDNIFSIVAMGCGLLLVLSVFLPYITYFSISSSLWKMENPGRIIYIISGLLVIAVYLINQKTELSYLAVGYGVFTTIGNLISNEGFAGLSIGFYLILLSSIAIGVITFLYKEENAIALINLSVSVNKSNPVINNQQQPINNQVQPMQQPMMNQTQPIQPQEQPVITGYDPMTGVPIYSNNNNN